MKVLVVDDSADNRYFFESLLKEQGHGVTGAGNGAEALEKLAEDKFNLIISDINMPVMDGFHLLQECKNNVKLHKIPFIFITGVYLDREDEDVALKLGVKAFLRKPVEPVDLITAIDTATSSTPAPAGKGRKPKNLKPDKDAKLVEERLAAKLAKKIEELEAENSERKQAESALRESEEQYHLLFETMAQGVVYQDVGGKVVSANPAALKILGLTQDQIKGHTFYDTRWHCIHEDGSNFPVNEYPAMISLKTGQAVRNARMGIFNQVEERHRWISVDAVPLTRPGEDKPYRVYSTLTDITESLFAHKAIMESQSRLHTILENTADAIFSIDRDYRLITANSTAKRRYKEATGHDLREGMEIISHIPGERRPFWINMTDRALKGERSTFTMHYQLKSGEFEVEFSAYPVVSASGYVTGFSFFGRDITEKKMASENLTRNSRLFQMLFLCNEAMVHALQEQDLLQNICRVLVETGGYRMAWVGYPLNDENKSIRPAAYYGTDENYLNSINITWSDDERGKGPAGKAVRTGLPVICQDIAKDTEYQPWYEEAARHGYAGKVALPLKDNGNVFGVLNIYAARPDFFTDDEVTLLEQLAEDLAYGTQSLRQRDQMRKTESSLKESEERYRIASQSTSDLVWEWDISTGHIEWAGKIDEMLGCEEGEFPTTLEAWGKALHPDDHDRVMEMLHRHAQTGEPYHAEYRILQQNGTIRYWVDRRLVLRDDNGDIKRSIGACTDITEKRLSEQRSIIRRDLALKLASSTDLNRSLEDSLEAAIKISGCDAGAIHLLDEESGAFKIAVHSGFSTGFIMNFESFERDSAIYHLVMKGTPEYITIDTVLPPLHDLIKGEDLNFIAIVPIHYQDSVIGCIGLCSHTVNGPGVIERNLLVTIGTDIEGVIVRIRSSRLLEESEKRYKFIADHTDDVIWVADKYLHFTYYSPSVIRQRGFTVEEALSQNITQVITPASVDRLAKIVEAELVPGLQQQWPETKTLITELEVYHKDGSIRWTETSMTMLLDSDGNFDGIFGISRDITARRKAEEALRESEERYRTILEEMNEGYFETDASGNYTFFNDTLCKQMGYTREELLSLNYKVYVRPQDRKKRVSIFSEVFRTGIPAHNVPLVNIRKDGSMLNVEDSILPIRNEKGEITGLRGLARDISARMKYENELKKRASLLDSAYDSIIAFNEVGDIVYANETAANSRGYSVPEMLSMNLRQFVPADNVALFEERMDVINRLGEPSFEVVHIARDGSILNLELRVRSIVVEGARLFIAVYRDITARKKMQKELMDSEARYRGIIETAGATVIAIDMSGNLTYVNDLGCETMGYSRDELLGRPFADLVYPDDRAKIIAPFTEAAGSSEPTQKGLIIEFRALRRDGNIVWFYASPTRLITDGKAIGFSAVMPNITALKYAEASLQESEQRYRSLFLYNPAAAYSFDLEGNFVSVNDATCKMTEFSRKELLAMSFKDLLIPEKLEATTNHFILTTEGQPQNYETTILSKSENRIDLRVTNTPIIIDNRIAGVYGIAENITELKKAQDALQESEQRYRSLFENNPVAVYLQDLNGRFMSVNDATCRITGYSREEILALSPKKVIVPEDMETGRQRFIEAIRGKPQTYEQTIINKSGNRIHLNVTNISVKVNEKIVGVYSVSEDITERKKAEADLKSALGVINATLESTIDAIAVMSELRDPYTAGHQRMVTLLAVAIAHELGLPEEQVKPLRVAGLLHDVGKVYVPSEILSKPGKLSDLERNLAKAHAEAGYDIVRTIKFPWPVAHIIRQHHERIDGSGYPQGLKGDQITLEARILAVADVVEAMMAHRPYRPALGVDEALEEIINNRGVLYYEEAVDACVLLFREKGFNFTE